MIARPAVFLRPIHHMGGNGIEFDVSVTFQQILRGIDGTRLVSPFPQSTATAISLIYKLRIPATDHFHRAGDAVFVFRCHQQMYVIGHQAIRVEFRPVARHCLSQVIQVELVTFFIKKAGFSIVPALNYMISESGDVHPCSSRHSSSFA